MALLGALWIFKLINAILSPIFICQPIFRLLLLIVEQLEMVCKFHALVFVLKALVLALRQVGGLALRQVGGLALRRVER